VDTHKHIITVNKESTMAKATTKTTAVSVVVPTYNEAPNVLPLVKRIDKAMKQAGMRYEVIFIDDRSDDSTPDIIRSLKYFYPVRVYTKQGTKGKAYSLIEGFDKAKYSHICMIDGDLQYPPEAIPGMAKLLGSQDADIVQTRRVDNNTSALRKLSTRIFNFIFAQLLFGIKFDTQSGLKLFKKEILSRVDLHPGAWTFDLDFLVKSLQQGYKVVSYDIVFSERLHGEAKISVFSAASEMAIDSVKLKYKTSRFGRLHPVDKLEKIGARNLVIAAVVVAAIILGVSGSASALQQKPATASPQATSLLKAIQLPAAITGPVNDDAHHKVLANTSNAYSDAGRQQALRRGALFAKIGGLVLGAAILVMFFGATLYVAAKSKQRTGKFAIQ
jgi:glycosyltransferase involved in cell wall biosynthesis